MTVSWPEGWVQLVSLLLSFSPPAGYITVTVQYISVRDRGSLAD